MKDYTEALAHYQGNRYDNSYIGRLSYARWEAETEDTRFTTKCVKNGSEVQCLQVEAWNDSHRVGLLEAWIFFADFKGTGHTDEEAGENSSGTYWRTFHRDEVMAFARRTGDFNPIHLTAQPVVQGLLIMSALAETWHSPDFLSINFRKPVHADEPVFLKEETDYDRTKLVASCCSRSFRRSIPGKTYDDDCRLCSAVSRFGVHLFSAAVHPCHGDGPDHHGEFCGLCHGA
jgi:hypothetical protein